MRQCDKCGYLLPCSVGHVQEVWRARSRGRPGTRDGGDRDGTEIKSETRIEYEGRPATDAVLEDPEGYEVRVLAIIDGSRVDVLLTHATERNDILFETLRDSLELTA